MRAAIERWYRFGPGETVARRTAKVDCDNPDVFERNWSSEPEKIRRNWQVSWKDLSKDEEMRCRERRIRFALLLQTVERFAIRSHAAGGELQKAR
jgi:hypothetical protein